ncbi:MAG: efflux RND transporter periplasmic adaptor subunit [Alphaproteobacteria bacterium]
MKMLKPLFDKHRPLVTIVFGAVVGLFGVWFFSKILKFPVRHFCQYVLRSDKDNKFLLKDRVAKVEAEVVKLRSLTKRIVTVGKLRANQAVTIRSEIHGRIKEILFIEGGEVQEGDEIIKLEDADVLAEVKKAEADLMLREADFKRISSLHDKRIGATKDLDKAKAELEVSKSNLEVAKVRFEKASIKAPFSGAIGITDVSVGAYLQAGQDLVTIVDNDPIKVDFKVPEKYINSIGQGQTVEIKIDAFGGQTFQGTLEAIDSKIDTDSHSIALKAVVPNEKGTLYPGLFAHVHLITAEQGDAVMIPEACVDREGEIEYVWIVEKGKARQRRVLTGAREEGRIEIIAGLKEGDIVVTVGQIKLGAGVRVKIVNQLEEEKQEPEEKEIKDGDSKEQGVAKEEKVEVVDSNDKTEKVIEKDKSEAPEKSVVEKDKDIKQSVQKESEDVEKSLKQESENKTDVKEDDSKKEKNTNEEKN